MKQITVAVIGASGKMGQTALLAIQQMKNYRVVAEVKRNDSLDKVLKEFKPDIAIELTSSETVLAHSKVIIDNNVRPVIGSSGLSRLEIKELQQLCANKQLGGLIIPNFSIGIAVINKFTKEIKKYYDDFSVIEFHHRQKKDKPSGTARHTASILDFAEEEIASVRSNGFLAKQQLYVNNPHERIIIDHESFDRNSFIQGIQISLEKSITLSTLVVGLENIV